jgi:3-hydroxyacyl-[acyl-carrier-protein] dehydratase
VRGHWTDFDRLEELEPGRSARAVRNVPNTLAIFDSHFPRFPTMPGVLILGTLGTLAARLLEEDGDGRAWRLAGAGNVGFRHFVQPGDQMELTVTLKQREGDEALLTGEVRVDGRVVTRARRLRMVPS